MQYIVLLSRATGTLLDSNRLFRGGNVSPVSNQLTKVCDIPALKYRLNTKGKMGTWGIESVPDIGEEENNVGSGALVQVGEQLLDAKLKHDVELAVVGLEEDADAMDFVIA